MKAWFFHAELVNRFHATAAQSKGSRARAVGGEAGRARGDPGRKTLHHQELLKPTSAFQNLT